MESSIQNIESRKSETRQGADLALAQRAKAAWDIGLCGKKRLQTEVFTGSARVFTG